MPSGHAIEELHVRFQFGLLDSCRVDVFVPAESASISPIPSLICSDSPSEPKSHYPRPWTPQDSTANVTVNPGQPKLSPPGMVTSQSGLTSPVYCARTALALVITGLLGEGHRSDVFKVEASLLQADDEGEIPTTLMALKVSGGPDGLAALQSEYRTYRYLAEQEGRRRKSVISCGSHKGSDLIVPKAYGVFRFDMEGDDDVIGGLLLSYEPGVPAWQLSVEKWDDLQ